MSAAIDFLLGDESPATLGELRAGMARWLQQQGEDSLPMHRVIGLGGPRMVRCELRSIHLAAALDLMPGRSRWKKCQALAECARTFQTRRLDRWQRLGPPADAAPVDLHLWEARALGEALPESPERYLQIFS